VTVHLVGAGPGDPGLITARGLELIRGCDALVHDRLVHHALVAEAPDDALVIDRDGLAQAAVEGLLVQLGRHAASVVRLKGGDPFVYGRGCEEALALAAAGIDVEVVPGVSSLAAVPAAAGIPVTHRGISDTVTIVSGHGADGGEPDYERLARAGGTLVVFMGRERLRRVATGLVDAGLDPDTPAAVIANGTLPHQRVATGSLREIADLADTLPAPALTVIGDVVRLRSALRRRGRLLAPAVAPGAA
jgi:uroporphyrin-III C-methyltransferase